MKAMLMRAGVIAAAVGIVLAGAGPASSARSTRDAVSASDSSAFSAVAAVLRGLDSASSTGYSDSVLSDAPVAYWRLGEGSGLVAVDGVSGAPAGAYHGGV